MSVDAQKSNEIVAYHESGHFVMAVLKKLATHSISILPDKAGSEGRVTFRKARLLRRAYSERTDGRFVANPRASDSPRQSRKRIQKELLVSLAGCAAEAWFHSPPPLRSSNARIRVTDEAIRLLALQGTSERMNDEKLARKLADRIHDSTPIESFIPVRMLNAISILEEQHTWKAIKTLTKELLKSGELSSRHARSIVTRALAADSLGRLDLEPENSRS